MMSRECSFACRPAAFVQRCAIVVAAALLATGASAQEAELPALRAAAKANAKEAAPALALGKALRRAGRFSEAATELLRGAALGSATKGGLNVALAYELARVRQDQRDIPNALKACDALGKQSALSNACRAEAFLTQKRASEALPLVEKAIAAEPNLYEARVNGARAFALQGKVQSAEVTFRRAAEINGARPEAYYWLGDFLLNQGRRDEGIEALKKAMAADPGDPEIGLRIGAALRASKEGQAALIQATKIRPSFAEAYAELARSSIELGDFAAAEAAGLSAVKLDVTLFPAHLALAQVALKKARWDDAIKSAEAVKKLVPNAAPAELAIADARAGKGEVDLAAEAYQRAFGLDRTDPTPLVRATRVCALGGRPTTARGFADKVTTEFPKWAPGWVELGDLLARQNEKDKARAAYETALKGEGPIDREQLSKKIADLKAAAPKLER
jgi:tetratricopeptide (TPR) repeat protein